MIDSELAWSGSSVCSGGRGLSLRISVTDRCQLRCRYCMPPDGIASCRREDVLQFEEITLFARYLQQHFGVAKVRFTGGDPLARRGMPELVDSLSRLDIPDLAMTTNAQQLAGVATELREAGLQRINISLDSLDTSTFSYISRGGVLDRTLAGIDAALNAGLGPVKLNTVVMRGVNDHEVCDLLSFAMERECELRFLELMPIGYGSDLFNDAFVSTASVRHMLASHFELESPSRACGSSSRRCRVRRMDGLEGVVGFISPCTDPFCSGCSRLRLTADGHLIGCLARDDGVSIRPYLGATDDEALAAVVREALQSKRSDQHFAQTATMAAIGG